jgi:hypothetical protein
MDTTINSRIDREANLNQTVNSQTSVFGLSTHTGLNNTVNRGKKKTQKVLSLAKLQREINRDFKKQYEEYLLQQVVLQGDVPNFFYHDDKFAFANNS